MLTVNCYTQEKDALEEVAIELTDSTKSRSKFNGYPYAFYTPESKFAVGAGGIFIFFTGEEDGLNPSKIGFGGYYSSNNQYKISMNNAYYFFNNKLYFNLPLSYGYFVDKFWGIGDNTETTGQEPYKMKTFTASMTIQVPPIAFLADRTGLIIDYNNTEIVEKDSNQYLINDAVYGSNGGQLFGIGTDLVWDSRDNIFFPNTGGYQYFKAVIYPGMSDFTFASIELDVKHFWAFKPDHVFATNIYFKGVTGDTPFYQLPALGGAKRMRGFFHGRYRDNVYLMMQVEYRQYFYKRFGFVVFGGTGNVSDNILTYDFHTLKWSYGAGLRFLFNKKQKINLRMDIGFGSQGNSGIYFGIEEAF
jgi:outer membrane protein assembly factor BamA